MVINAKSPVDRSQKNSRSPGEIWCVLGNTGPELEDQENRIMWCSLSLSSSTSSFSFHFFLPSTPKSKWNNTKSNKAFLVSQQNISIICFFCFHFNCRNAKSNKKGIYWICWSKKTQRHKRRAMKWRRIWFGRSGRNKKSEWKESGEIEITPSRSASVAKCEHDHIYLILNYCKLYSTLFWSKIHCLPIYYYCVIAQIKNVRAASFTIYK